MSAPAPPAYASLYPTAPTSPADDAAARQALARQGFPPGLQAAAVRSRAAFGARYWIVDNSGSMSLPDGKRLVAAGASERLVACTRWQEATQAALHAGELAAALGAPTEFRFLNAPASGPQSLTVAGPEDLPALRAACESEPSGGTPLCAHAVAVATDIAARRAELAARGQRASVTIVSDGLPSDGDLAAALQPFASLPMWIVVRLCTNEEEVVNFWNGVDAQLECDMDVLDDLEGEAAEVCSLNPWLTYAPELHRLREFGVRDRVLDLVDERSLTGLEAKAVVELILGGDALPEPEVDLEGFMSEVHRRLADLPLAFDPRRQRRAPWVDVRALRRAVRQASCAVA